jgi:hypothetical protein
LISTRLNGDIAIAMVETLVLVVLALVALLLASRLGGPGVRGAGKGISPAPRRQTGGWLPMVLGWAAVGWLLLPHLALLLVSFVPADYLALVGDAADGYPGIKGIGKVSAARMLNEYGPIEDFPENVLVGHREHALLFKQLATLRTDARLFRKVDELKWNGPTESFAKLMTKMNEPRLLARALGE